MVYQFKQGSFINPKVNPQIAGEMCASLEAQGMLSAKALVDVNRPKDAPLHNAFTWDNKKAAERWREQEARHIINCIVVQQEENAEPVRQFFTIAKTDAQYHSIEFIMRESNSRDALLVQALAELKAFERKYRQLTELAKVFEIIDEMEEEK